MIIIKREAGIAAISGIIGALAAKGVDKFSNNFPSGSWQANLSNLVGFGIFFFVLLLAANYLFCVMDERTIKKNKNTKPSP